MLALRAALSTIAAQRARAEAVADAALAEGEASRLAAVQAACAESQSLRRQLDELREQQLVLVSAHVSGQPAEEGGRCARSPSSSSEGHQSPPPTPCAPDTPLPERRGREEDGGLGEFLLRAGALKAKMLAALEVATPTQMTSLA